MVWRNTPKAVAWLVAASSILGLIGVLLNYVLIGTAVVASTIVVFVIIELYNVFRAQEARERAWIKAHHRRKQEPPPQPKGGWVQVAILLVAVPLLSWGCVAAYRKFIPPPFAMASSTTFWSTSNASVPAYFFAYIPGRQMLTMVNAAIYIRLVVGTQRQTITKYEGFVFSDNKWVPLLPMPEANDTFIYYWNGTSGKGTVGWKLSPKLGFIEQTEEALEAGDTVQGWLFFAYKDNLSSDATKLRITITNSQGQSVTRDFLKNDPKEMDLLHLPQFPDLTKPPTDLSRYEFNWYAKITGQ